MGYQRVGDRGICLTTTIALTLEVCILEDVRKTFFT